MNERYPSHKRSGGESNEIARCATSHRDDERFAVEFLINEEVPDVNEAVDALLPLAALYSKDRR